MGFFPNVLAWTVALDRLYALGGGFISSVRSGFRRGIASALAIRLYLYTSGAGKLYEFGAGPCSDVHGKRLLRAEKERNYPLADKPQYRENNTTRM